MAIVGHDEFRRRLEEIERSDSSATETYHANMTAIVDQALVEVFHEHDTVAEALRALGYVRAAGVLDERGPS